MGCMEQYEDQLTVCPHCGFQEGTESDNALHMATGSILADRYVIGRVIGFGGFGNGCDLSARCARRDNRHGADSSLFREARRP